MSDWSRADDALHRCWDSAARAWDWLFSAATPWELRDLGTFLHWTVPVMIVVSVALVLVQRQQAATMVQRALSRFLVAKLLFWVVFELSFYLKLTVFWVIADALVLAVAIVTALDLLARLLLRYVFVRRGEPTSPHI